MRAPSPAMGSLEGAPSSWLQPQVTVRNWGVNLWMGESWLRGLYPLSEDVGFCPRSAGPHNWVSATTGRSGPRPHLRGIREARGRAPCLFVSALETGKYEAGPGGDHRLLPTHAAPGHPQPHTASNTPCWPLSMSSLLHGSGQSPAN